MPRASAPDAYSTIQSGVRCAETTFASCGTPKRVSISSAWRIVSQSDLLPMMRPTRGCITRLLSLCQSIAGGAIETAERLRLHDFNSLIEDAFDDFDFNTRPGFLDDMQARAHNLGADSVAISDRD